MPARNPTRPHSLNLAGVPFLYPCGHCLHDFGGRTLLDRHRNEKSGHCKTPEEMWEMGWWMDRHGRWRQRDKHRREWE